MHTVTGTPAQFSAEFQDAVAQYRHRIFIERLGWPLPVVDAMERDQFDRGDTVYVVGRDERGAICGCARLLPTTRPYLLSEVFPNLVPDSNPPCSPEVWELSRFAAAAGDAGAAAAISSRHLLAAAVAAARERGAARLITVSPLGIERLLYRMGVHAHRAGPPVFVDGKPVFACWIEIDEQTIAALGLPASAAQAEPVQLS